MLKRMCFLLLHGTGLRSTDKNKIIFRFFKKKKWLLFPSNYVQGMSGRGGRGINIGTLDMGHISVDRPDP